MNEEIKRQWVTALRSGEYQQTKYRLKSIKGFCCLGVLCDLYAKEHNIHWSENINPDIGNIRYRILDEHEVLPEQVQKWAGIKTNSPDVEADFYDEQETIPAPLTQLNDDYNYDFNHLADLIEEQL